MRKITKPDWMRNLPGDALLNTTDMANLFGYKNADVVASLVSQGRFPQPTLRQSRGTKIPLLMWKVSEVREIIKQTGEKSGH